MIVLAFCAVVWIGGMPFFYLRFEHHMRETVPVDGKLARDLDVIALAMMTIVWPMIFVWAIGRWLSR